MVKVLVWVLVLHPWNGTPVVYDNLATEDSCERLLGRSRAAVTATGQPGITGICTQVEKFVPAQVQPVINISPPEIKVPPARVIIRDKK